MSKVFKIIYRTYISKIIILLVFCLVTIFISRCENDSYPYFIKSSDHGTLWVANSGDNTVSCISRYADEVIGTYPVGPNPSRTAVDLNGNCWVGSRGDGTVYFVSQDGEKKMYSGFDAARGVALDQEGNVWVANSGNNTIQKITIEDTTATVSSQLTINVNAQYYYGALVDANNYLWVLDREAYNLSRYDISQFPNPSAYDLVQLPGPIYGFTIDPNNTVWVAGFTTSALYKINGNDATLDTTYHIPSELFAGYATGVTFDINGNIWLSGYTSHCIFRFDTKNENFQRFDSHGDSPHGLGTGDAGFIYTINLNSNNISKIDARNGEFIKSIEVGNAPYTYSDLTGFIYRQVTLGGQ